MTHHSRRERRIVRIGIAVLACAVGLSTGIAFQQPDDVNEESQTSTAELESRGRYLVHHVAMCVQCHSGRNAAGDLVELELLRGGRIPVSSPFPDQEWAVRAPMIAGFPGGWSRDELVTFLQTGKRPSAPPTRAPMPPYRMTEEDAQAVAAYLASLGR